MECKIIAGGFSFCGTDIKDLGLEYAPEKENTYVYSPAETAIYEETFDGHNGGYLYGTAKKPKEFTLRCFFENEHIARGMMAKVHQVFRPGRSGKLIFKRRPWCYYYATVSEVPSLELSNYMNGLITIHMKAYYPFARAEAMTDDPLSPFYSERTDACHGEIMLNTGLFEKRAWVPPMAFTEITQQESFVLSNPGTERASVGIVCAGDAPDGLIITNSTTGQECKLVALSKAETTDVNKHVYIDGISGKTVLTDSFGSDKKLSFLFHDYGFIELEPCVPVIRKVFINYPGTQLIHTVNRIEENVIGLYIYAAGTWHKIVEQPDIQTLKVKDSVGATGDEISMIAPMNELTVTPVSTMDITRLSFVYVPTFA